MEVDITCDGYEETCVVLEDGYIHMCYLDLYPKPFGIFYEKNGKLYPTKKEENKFKAVDGVFKYKIVFTPTSTSKSSLSEQQQVKFSDIMSNIHDFSENSNENKPKVKIGKKKTVEKPRLINVAWLNRDGEDLPFEKMGKEKTLSLIKNQKYFFEDILAEAKKLFVRPATQEFFNGEKTRVQLATKDGAVLNDFETNGKKQDLWSFFEKKPSNGHRIHVNLVTTYLKSSELKEVLKDVNNLSRNEKSRSVDDSSLSYDDVNLVANMAFGAKRSATKKAIKDGFNFIRENNNKKRKDVILNEPLVDLKKPKSVPTITNFSSKKLSGTNHFPISQNNFNKSSLVSAGLPSKTVSETENSQPSTDNIFGRTISSINTPLADPFKRPIGEPKPRKCAFELDNVHKVPLPFMTEIPNSHLTITEQYLGSGAFGTVKLGFHNRTEVAIKVIDILGTTSKTILKEIAVLKEINHENIVSIVGVCCQYSEFWIVMGLVKGHNLKEIIYKPNIKKLYGLLEEDKSFAILVNFSIQLLKGMTYIEKHHLGITHRDVKPTNILISTELKQLKICDMGLAKVKEFGSLLLTTQGKEITVGTRPYMAPELLIKKEDGTFELASKFSDAWAVSCTLIEMFQEKHIWDVGGTYDYTHPIMLLRKKQEPLILEKVPDSVKNILIKGLNYDHKKRATCEHMFDEFLKL